jgi:hypothetical protein
MEGAAPKFHVLIKKEDDLFIAHCLELDIVTTANAIDQVKRDIVDLIVAQVDYAFSNDNLDNLYHPAPPEVWEDFFDCRNQVEEISRPIKSSFKRKPPCFVPSQITTSTCCAFG